MYTVIAAWRARPESVDTVRDLLSANARASQQEPGCLTFHAHQDLEDPARFMLYEVYRSSADFLAHRESEHFRTYVEEGIAPLLVEREWRGYGPPL
jgi:quinol monooxygenase YgiN